MALSNYVVWEIRSDTGASTNGGGFDPTVSVPGTDYTYPTSSPITYTDIVIGATTTTATSVIRPFVAADVGNTFNLTSGGSGTVGRYTAISLSGTTMTFDRSLGTASTGIHGVLGGAFDTWNNWDTFWEAYYSSAGGGAVWVRATGTYTLSTATAFSSRPATFAAPMLISGYTSTRGDNGQATITCGTPTTYGITLGSYYTCQNLYVNYSTNIIAFYLGGLFVICINCAANCTSGSKTGSGFVMINASSAIFSCYAQGCITGLGFLSNANTGINCYAENCTTGFSSTPGSAYVNTLQGCTARNCVTGMNIKGTTLLDCTAYGNSGDGFYLTASAASFRGVMVNCLAVSNGGYGVNSSAIASQIVILGLATYNNTSGAYLSTLASYITNAIALTSDPTVNGTGSPPNFTLKSSSGASGTGWGLSNGGAASPTSGYSTLNSFGSYNPAISGGVGIIDTSMSGGMS